MTTPYSCPDCGGVLDLDLHAETETPVYRQQVGRMPYLEQVRRPAIVAFCTQCEFAIEVEGVTQQEVEGITEQEHAFRAGGDTYPETLYCLHCGASETEHTQ